MDSYDVAVVGGGNAALCAAIAAHEQGANVLVIERAPKGNRGGNSAFTGGAFRIAYRSVDDLLTLVPDLHPEEIKNSDFGTYTEDQFFEEVVAMSGYRADADVLDTVVAESLPAMQWLRTHGVRFVPIYGRQSFKVDGKQKFWGGLTVEVSGGGLGLMAALYARAEQLGITFQYGGRANRMERCGDEWEIGVESQDRSSSRVCAKTVILATGGYHANLLWRAQYLGPNSTARRPAPCRSKTPGSSTPGTGSSARPMAAVWH